jgi:Flp pilus assembly protein TadG
MIMHRLRLAAPVVGGSLRRLRDSDEGSASLEFVVLGVLLMVPLAYLMITVFAVQSAAYGVSAASREAGRAYVQSPAGADPGERAYAAARVALRDHGIDLARDQVSITCSAEPCLTPGAAVEVRVDVAVGLPWVPELFGEVPASVAVHGEHTAVVDRFRPGGG